MSKHLELKTCCGNNLYEFMYNSKTYIILNIVSHNMAFCVLLRLSKDAVSTEEVIEWKHDNK